jgi:hypothetical protein
MLNESSVDNFQSWLAHMDDALNEWVLKLPQQVQNKLDSTADSLVPLEELLLKRYESVAASRPPVEGSFLDGAARYVGEICRLRTGAKWAFQSRDPKDAYFNLPVIMGGSLGQSPICPLSCVTASLDRRTGRYLSDLYAKLPATTTSP